jgi:hypothetical protein
VDYSLVRPGSHFSMKMACLLALFFIFQFLTPGPAVAQQAQTISQMVAAENRGQAPAIGKTQAIAKQLAAPSRDFRQARQVRTPINWAAAKSAASSHQRAGRKLNRTLDKAAISAIDMPVIIPQKLSSGHLLFGEDYYYHVVTRMDGYSVSVHGTCVLSEVRSPGDKKAATDGMHIFQTEDGMAASFSLFGAAYSVMMVCDDPAGDNRCKSAAFMKNLVDGMVVEIGGGK